VVELNVVASVRPNNRAIVRTNRCFRMRRGYLRSGGSGLGVSLLGVSAVSSSGDSAASPLVVVDGCVVGVSFVWRVVSAVLSNRTLFLVFFGGLLVFVRAFPSVVPLASAGFVPALCSLAPGVRFGKSAL